MKLLIISDLHAGISEIEKLAPELKAADLVLCAGDFAKFGAPDTSIPTLKALLDQTENVFAVCGNCDEPSFKTALESADISVEGSPVFRDGLCFCGAGGGLKFTGETPNERDEDDLISDLAEFRNLAAGESFPNSILIIHQPPFGTGLDKVAPDVHVGSKAVTELVSTLQPLMLISGHIHESAAIENIGNTVAINPGPLFEGNFVRVEIQKIDGSWKVIHCEQAKL